MNQIQQEQYTGKGGIYQQPTLPIKEVFNEYGGKGNLTRKKLRELADKQLPPNAEFVHGVGKRKSEWQKRYEKLDSL